MRKPEGDTLAAVVDGVGWSYGPRVSDGFSVDLPGEGRQPEFFGVYRTEADGRWSWVIDAHDEESAARAAILLSRVPAKFMDDVLHSIST